MRRLRIIIWVSALIALTVCAQHQAKATDTSTVLAGYIGQDVTAELQLLLNKTGASGPSHATYINFPAGDFYLSKTIIVPNDRAVFIAGGGPNTTRLWWTDQGPGQFAITKADGGFGLHIENLSLEGPNLNLPGPFNTTPTTATPNGLMGSMPARMDGLNAISCTECRNVTFSGFRSGAVIYNNHQQFASCTFQDDYYGVYFVQAPGCEDQSFIECDFTGDRCAGVACAAKGTIGGVTFLRCHTGFEPYCFYRETGSGGYNWISACQFLQCQMEGPGNGGFYDEDGDSPIIQNTFMQCSTNGFYGFNIPGRPIGPFWKCGGVSDNTFDLCLYPQSMSVQQINGNRWSAPAGFFSIGNNAYTQFGGVPNVSCAGGVTSNTITAGDDVAILMTAANTIKAGQFVEAVPGDGTGYACQAVTATGNMILGVSLYPVSPGQVAMIIQRGIVYNVPVANSVRSNEWAEVNADGGVSGYPQSTGSGSLLVGWTIFAPGNNTATLRLKLGL